MQRNFTINIFFRQYMNDEFITCYKTKTGVDSDYNEHRISYKF